MRSGIAGLMIGLVVLGAAADRAWALDPDKRELMKKHFAELGSVKYELFAPLGGLDVGAVLLQGSGNADELRVVKLQPSGGFNTVYAGSLTSAGLSGRQPFTFLQAGQHLLTYPTVAHKGPGGTTDELGDLTVYDLSGDGAARMIFTIPGLVNLGVQASGALSNDNIIRQPSRHFLNTGGRLPVKYDYFRLSFDSSIGQYRIYHHLTPMPNGMVEEAANFNNRSLADYYAGRMMDATRGLERATMLSETNQSTVYRNQDLIKSELDDLAAQSRFVKDRPNDDALLAFWQGDFNLVVRLIGARPEASRRGLDLAMLGIALAQLRRWPEADRITGVLAENRYEYLGDYAAELLKVAESQKLPPVIEIQLKALERFDPGHPMLEAALSRVLLRGGQSAQAEGRLLSYLSRNATSGRDLGPVRLQLYELYNQTADQAGMDRLVKAAMTGHGGYLRGFVALADYLDFRGAYTDVPLEERDRIKAPKTPLDEFVQAPPGYTPDPQ